MAVPSYVHNLDDNHLKALSLLQRLDVAALWRVETFLRMPDGSSIQQPTNTGSRAQMTVIARIQSTSILEMIALGFIIGGTAMLVPINFEYKGPNAKFDMVYGFAFGTAEEVAEEMAARGL